MLAEVEKAHPELHPYRLFRKENDSETVLRVRVDPKENPLPKTLAMRKMEKNFIAVLEKQRPRDPYHRLDAMYLMRRVEQEVTELRLALEADLIDGAMWEIADVENVLEYLFESLMRVLIDSWSHRGER